MVWWYLDGFGLKGISLSTHQIKASTFSTVPKVLPIASAMAFFMHLKGRLWNWTQKDTPTNIASSTDSSSFALYKPTKYVSKDQGPCERIFSRPTSSSKIIRTVFDPKSWTSKFWTKRHMLHKVLASASKLTRHFVKNLATRTLLLFSMIGGRSIVSFSTARSKSRAHLPVSLSMRRT